MSASALIAANQIDYNDGSQCIILSSQLHADPVHASLHGKMPMANGNH